MIDPEHERRRLDATIDRLLRITAPSELAPRTPQKRPKKGDSPAALLKTAAVIAAILATLLLVLVVLRRAPFFALLPVVLLVLGGTWAWWSAGLREKQESAGEHPDAELLRTGAAIKRLREALSRAPSAMQSFVPDAERALEAISRGALALERRASSLATVLEGLGSGRIEKEHAELLSRLIQTSEPEAHGLLEQALASSERKRQRVQELRTWAERVAAERLRIRHALEATHLDVERAIAANLPPLQGEAAWNLGRLTDEIGAIAEALERHAAIEGVP